MRPGIGFGQPGRPHGRRQERLPPLTADNPRDVDAPPLDGFQPQTSGVLDHLVQEPQRTPHRHPGRGQRGTFAPHRCSPCTCMLGRGKRLSLRLGRSGAASLSETQLLCIRSK